MLEKILKVKSVKQLKKSKLKEVFGGDVTGKDDANSNITWKCYRNDSGSNFFFSSVDLNSVTTICYAIPKNSSAPILSNPDFYSMG